MSPELLDHIQPDVRLRRRELADQENAYSLWAEAALHLAPFEIAEYEAFEEQVCTCDQDLGHWLPAGAAREKLREQIERNRRALETANLGLSLGRFQYPEPCGHEHFAEDAALIDFLRQVTRLRDFKARLHASCGEFSQAARELTNSLRTAELALAGDGIIVNYLVGIACQGKALAGMLEMARLHGAPANAIAEMLAALERDWHGAEELAQSMRCDFHYYFLKQLAPLSEGDNRQVLVDLLLKDFYSDSSILRCDALGPHPDGRSEWRRQRLLELLEGHPAPFDAAATLSASSHELAEIIRRCSAPWRASRDKPKSQPLLPEDYWPVQLRPAFPYDLLGPGPDARQAVAELSESTPDCAERWRVPDDAAFSAAREKLRKIDNPVGRLLAQSALGVGPNCVDILFRSRAAREATKAVLALRLHQVQRGRLPDDLESLVEAGLLSTVPADPFTDEPLSYSCQRAIVWSVGPDDAKQSGEPPANLVWSVTAA